MTSNKRKRSLMSIWKQWLRLRRKLMMTISFYNRKIKSSRFSMQVRKMTEISFWGNLFITRKRTKRWRNFMQSSNNRLISSRRQNELNRLPKILMAKRLASQPQPVVSLAPGSPKASRTQNSVIPVKPTGPSRPESHHNNSKMLSNDPRQPPWNSTVLQDHLPASTRTSAGYPTRAWTWLAVPIVQALRCRTQSCDALKTWSIAWRRFMKQRKGICGRSRLCVPRKLIKSINLRRF